MGLRQGLHGFSSDRRILMSKYWFSTFITVARSNLRVVCASEENIIFFQFEPHSFLSDYDLTILLRRYNKLGAP